MVLRHYLLALAGLLLTFSQTSGQRGGSLILTTAYGPHYYYGFYSLNRFTWQQAQQECSERMYVLAKDPVPSIILTSLQQHSSGESAWISNDQSQCIRLKEECSRWRNGVFSPQCEQESYKPELTPCQQKYHYIVCQRDPETTRPPTTTTTTTTTTPTTTPTTTTTRKPITRPQTTDWLATSYTGDLWVNFRTRPTKPPIDIKKKFVGHMASFLLGMSVSETTLLGLIIAVVSGVFFISLLFVGICCACRSKKRREKRKRYEYLQGSLSNGTFPRSVDRDSRSPGSRPSQETTTEESLTDQDISSERSYQHRESFTRAANYPSTLLPPPPRQAYENVTTASAYELRPEPSHAGSFQRRYQTYNENMHPDYTGHHLVYASVLPQPHAPSTSHYDELPFPPPPPPPVHPPPSVCHSRASSQAGTYGVNHMLRESESIELVATNL